MEGSWEESYLSIEYLDLLDLFSWCLCIYLANYVFLKFKRKFWMIESNVFIFNLRG